MRFSITASVAALFRVEDKRGDGDAVEGSEAAAWKRVNEGSLLFGDILKNGHEYRFVSIF